MGLLHSVVPFPPFSEIHLLFLFYLVLCKQSLALKASFLSHSELYHLLAELVSRQQSLACGCLPVLVHWMERKLSAADSRNLANSFNFLPLAVLHCLFYWLTSVHFWTLASHNRVSNVQHLSRFDHLRKNQVILKLLIRKVIISLTPWLCSHGSVRQQQRSEAFVSQSTINRLLSLFTHCSLQLFQDTEPHFPPPTPYLKDLKKLEWVQWSHEDDQCGAIALWGEAEGPVFILEKRWLQGELNEISAKVSLRAQGQFGPITFNYLLSHPFNYSFRLLLQWNNNILEDLVCLLLIKFAIYLQQIFSLIIFLFFIKHKSQRAMA